MQITLSNGQALSGTPEEMREFLNTSHLDTLAPGAFQEPPSQGYAFTTYPHETPRPNVGLMYRSSSRGPVPVSEMHPLHIKNAILQMHREDTHSFRSREFEGLVDELAFRLYTHEKEKENSDGVVS